MQMLNLLESFPKATTVIKEWLLSRMLDSLDDDNLPEDFKSYVKVEDLDIKNVAMIIEGNPRVLFDVFDKNEIYIQITYYEGPKFWCSINGVESGNKYDTRIEAEEEAIKGAFQMLNDKL